MKLLLSITCGMIILGFSVSCNNKDHSQNESPQPNIVMILADDLGYSDIGCYGSEIATPNLDRLAENGIRFTQVYNTSKCFPSRACLLTGAYAQQVNMDRRPVNIERGVTLGEMFRTAGYRTLWSGKHHGTENPFDRGFDRYYGLRDGACNHFNPGKQRPGEGKPAQKRPDRTWCIDSDCYAPYTPESDDFYTTDYFTNYALEWLDEYKNEENPFFLYMAYTAPHDPLMAWPEDIAKYEGKYMEGYAAIRQERFEKQKAIGLLDEDYTLPAAQHQDWDQLSDEEKQIADRKMAVYAAMIDRLDQNIGRIVKKIEEMGEKNNTLILFASDNGASAEVVNLEDSGKIGTITRWTSLGPDWANVGNTPLRYFKNYSYEGGIRTPFIAHWPQGIEGKNRFDHTPLHFIDLMITFAHLAGAEYPQTFDNQEIVPPQGINFAPVFQNEDVKRNQPLFWQWAKGRAVRDGDWKMVSWDGDWELYDLKNDPTEQNDLSSEHPDKVNELNQKYYDWAQKVGIIEIDKTSM